MATVTFKCPNCGGGLQFDPASQKYKCEYCLSEFEQEQIKAPEPDGAGAGDGRGPAAVVYTCPSCGAEIVTDETTAATFCFYCHNPVILEGRLDGAYEPDYVLPFTVGKEKAREIFLTWLKQKKFVPSSFYSPDQIEKMTGVYFPYWMYSCEVEGHLEAEGTKESRSWVQGSSRYTENQKYSIVREGSMGVEHLTRNALKKADRKLVEGVMPFEMKDVKPFTMGYLSGFLAEKRDIGQEELNREAEEEVRSFAASNLAASVEGYQNVQIRSQQMDVKNARWDYALLPVWTLTYKDSGSGKIYYFACNGQTGKVCGKLPVDKAKLAIFFAEIFVPLFVVLMIVGYFL